MRLIDADVFFDNLDAYSDKNKLQKMLDRQPTAYDIDKVVEELKHQSEQYRQRGFEAESKGLSTMADKYYGKQCSYEHSIEIVKQGSVSDDMCEWHCDEYGRWHTECHYLADNDPLEYTYCPYCGKKIKVVK